MDTQNSLASIPNLSESQAREKLYLKIRQPVPKDQYLRLMVSLTLT